MSAARKSFAIVAILAVLVAVVVLAQHRPTLAWHSHDRHSILAWDLGNVAGDVDNGAASDEQRSFDMLDMSLDKIRNVYYKPVDEDLLLTGERHGLLEYLKYRHISATLPDPPLTQATDIAQVDEDANKLLGNAIDK